MGSEEGGAEGTISEQHEPILTNTDAEGNIGVADNDGDVGDHVRQGAARWV